MLIPCQLRLSTNTIVLFTMSFIKCLPMATRAVRSDLSLKHRSRCQQHVSNSVMRVRQNVFNVFIFGNAFGTGNRLNTAFGFPGPCLKTDGVGV